MESNYLPILLQLLRWKVGIKYREKKDAEGKDFNTLVDYIEIEGDIYCFCINDQENISSCHLYNYPLGGEAYSDEGVSIYLDVVPNEINISEIYTTDNCPVAAVSVLLETLIKLVGLYAVRIVYEGVSDEYTPQVATAMDALGFSNPDSVEAKHVNRTLEVEPQKLYKHDLKTQFIRSISIDGKEWRIEKTSLPDKVVEVKLKEGTNLGCCISVTCRLKVAHFKVESIASKCNNELFAALLFFYGVIAAINFDAQYIRLRWTEKNQAKAHYFIKILKALHPFIYETKHDIIILDLSEKRLQEVETLVSSNRLISN